MSTQPKGMSEEREASIRKYCRAVKASLEKGGKAIAGEQLMVELLDAHDHYRTLAASQAAELAELRGRVEAALAIPRTDWRFNKERMRWEVIEAETGNYVVHGDKPDGAHGYSNGRNDTLRQVSEALHLDAQKESEQ